MTKPVYRGRFAPSPTGPLHFGSLVTALASYLDARHAAGQWLVRIEDLDPLRESSTAIIRICDSLEAHGLISDEPIRFQSQRHDAYDTVIAGLLREHRAYRCRCSRKELRAHGGRHPNRCRERLLPDTERPLPDTDSTQAIRFALQDQTAHWLDELLGPQVQSVQAELDDPVIRRKEGFYAYQLAVVVDDIDQAITHVVRGSDLLPMTAQQQQIYQALGYRPPHWLHIPVILNSQGQKLSKQTHAPALDDSRAGRNLWQALVALNQSPPVSLQTSAVATILGWASDHWQPERIHRHSSTGPVR